MQNRVGRARLELTEGALNDESWYQRLDASLGQIYQKIMTITNDVLRATIAAHKEHQNER